MDQHQGGSPFVSPSEDSSRSPVSPRTPTTEEAHRKSPCARGQRHLTPPFHPSPSRPYSSVSPTQATLVPSRRSRDLEVASHLASSSHEEVSLLSDPWPHAHAPKHHFTVGSSTFSTHQSHPLGRPVVFDEGTYERLPYYKDMGGEYLEPHGQRKGSSSSREDSCNPNGSARQALEYEAEHAGREVIPREGTGHATSKENGSMAHRSGPWESSRGQAIEEGDRWPMMVPEAKMSPALTTSPSSIPSQYPYSSSYPRHSSYLDSNPNTHSMHQSGSQSSPMVAPVDNHNRRQNGHFESLDRSMLDGEPRSSQYHSSQYQSHHHQHPRSQPFPQGQRSPLSRTSPPLSTLPSRPPHSQQSIAQTSTGTSTNGAGTQRPYGYPANNPPDHTHSLRDGEEAGQHSSTNPPHSNYSSSGPPPSSAPTQSSAPPPRSQLPQPRLPNLTRHRGQDDINHLPQPRLPNLTRHRGQDDTNREDGLGSSSSSRSSSKTRWEPTPRSYGSMHRKFGTDMPTTVDLRSAIEICDTLCQFAFHYAGQDPRESREDSSNEDEQDPTHRANLQMIRNLNSTMLTGLQPSSRGLDGETPTEGSDTKQPRMPTMDDGEDDSDDEEIRFGKGLPSNELVHELAKAATSIFQLSVRIKAWVSMTPEQRELDEEINIIRGKRCLFMDGSTAMPFPSLDAYSQYGSKLYGQDGLKGMYSRPRFNDTTAISISQSFRRPGDIGGEMRMQLEQERDYSQNSTPFGSYRSTASSHGGLADSLGDMRNKSGVRIPGSDEKDMSHQKYRKRAKRLHPPGRCQSCHTSDTPEWRRGPDGAGTLCNACGLQYAKLLKRQQQQRIQPPQNGQAGETDDESTKVRTIQPLDFQILKKPKAVTATETDTVAKAVDQDVLA